MSVDVHSFSGFLNRCFFFIMKRIILFNMNKFALLYSAHLFFMGACDMFIDVESFLSGCTQFYNARIFPVLLGEVFR